MKKKLFINDMTLAEGFLGQKMIVLPNTIRESQKKNYITRSFHISDMGFYPNASNHYRIRKKGANEYIFIYCVEGEGTLNVDGESIRVSPNSFYIIPKNTAHSYKAHEHNPWSIYWIHFDGLAAEALYERYLDPKKTDNSIPFESERISLFNQIYQIYQSEYVLPKLEYANILGLNLVSSFIYREVKDSVHMENHNNVVDSIIDFLNENLDKSYKSEEIAEKFNYSPSYLFNLFKKRTGYSLIHFFNLKKIQKACEYLKYTDLSIKEISYKMSFQDPLYFSRTFKKYIGVSPRVYRSQQHG
ncbi:MAG: helix-turn-helix domain-containing protein [Maribacter sp.]|jgi:AraC-like DNA-binding protein